MLAKNFAVMIHNSAVAGTLSSRSRALWDSQYECKFTGKLQILTNDEWDGAPGNWCANQLDDCLLVPFRSFPFLSVASKETFGKYQSLSDGPFEQPNGFPTRSIFGCQTICLFQVGRVCARNFAPNKARQVGVRSKAVKNRILFQFLRSSHNEKFNENTALRFVKKPVYRTQ